MLTSKQRAQLRGMANSMDTILQIGKDGINDNTIKQVDDALSARELIKCRVLETSPSSSREAADEMGLNTEGGLYFAEKDWLYDLPDFTPKNGRD